MTERKDQKAIIESILFLSCEPTLLTAFRDILELPESDIKELIEELMREYSDRNSGMAIVEVANGYQMVTNPAYSEWLKKYRGLHSSSRLSTQALETLAIIAYKQPIIRAEIEQIRGVNPDSALKTLYEKRLIKIMGRKEAPGRPFLYGTTREFLQYFGLKNLSELPTLKEFVTEEAA
ncbi:MAG: SMC-Scp complex subunit ScpB [Nitrospirota bacterium]